MHFDPQYIIPNICCSLKGPIFNRLAVVLLDCRHPCFRNFDPTISADVTSMKSYADVFFNPTGVPIRVSVNKLNLVPKRIVSGRISMFYLKL